MFTGIIESTGTVKDISKNGSGKRFVFESPISPALKIDQSVSHNGVCLTVENVDGNLHTVTAIEETLKKTNLGSLKTGETVNLERCMRMNGRLDGHIVQGHVDDTAECVAILDRDGSRELQFSFDPKFAALVIEKGSVCINGISLTGFEVQHHHFKVAIIPYTLHHTNIQYLQVGDTVNIEFDVIGKYILRMKEVQ